MAIPTISVITFQRMIFVPGGKRLAGNKELNDFL